MPEQPTDQPETGLQSGAKLARELAAMQRHDSAEAATDNPITPEQASSVEAADIDALKHQAGELHGINEVQNGLEKTILASGLQVMAERYGADKLLAALQSHTTTMGEVADQLAPDPTERAALQKAIEGEDVTQLGNRMNETLGGVASGVSTDSENLATLRRFGAQEVAEKKPTDGANQLMTGDLDRLLTENPSLTEKFRTTNDTLTLLKEIRGIYETKHATFVADLERTRASVESKIAEAEAGVAELQTLTDEVLQGEQANLEAKLASATSPEAKDMLQTLIDRRAAEAKTSRDELATRAAAIRSEITASLGAQALDQLPVAAPVRPQPVTHPYREG